ncbi:hypothetical protein SCLCIDRAFT_1211851 [Scleroderma citrinum Foug A]|uniref:Uncharacterized protein n=1 Tax=Scleroderma citrinum Foug A TaxID=1036808 RepID=A0A0C3DZ58_9AGAM|nr:hypothetical protein SCLCIDRAFT_1211851 [Scleroderma citrinum Foug A]
MCWWDDVRRFEWYRCSLATCELRLGQYNVRAIAIGSTGRTWGRPSGICSCAKEWGDHSCRY